MGLVEGVKPDYAAGMPHTNWALPKASGNISKEDVLWRSSKTKTGSQGKCWVRLHCFFFQMFQNRGVRETKKRPREEEMSKNDKTIHGSSLPGFQSQTLQILQVSEGAQGQYDTTILSFNEKVCTDPLYIPNDQYAMGSTKNVDVTGNSTEQR